MKTPNKSSSNEHYQKEIFSNSPNIEYFVYSKPHYEKRLKKCEFTLPLKYISEKQSDN